MALVFPKTHYKDLYWNLELPIFTFKIINNECVLADANKQAHKLSQNKDKIDSIFGLNTHELASRYPDNPTLQVMMDDIDKTCKEKKNRANEYWHTSIFSGLKRYFRTSTILLPDNFILIIIYDLTTEKELENSLQDSLAKVNDLMTSVPIGIMSSSIEGVIIEINDYLLSMLGFSSKAEVKNMTVQDLYYDNSERSIFLNKLDEGIVDGFEVKVKRKDGSPLWASVNAILKHKKNGEPFILSSFKDISNQKLLIASLKKREKELDSLSLLHNKAQRLAHIGHWKLDNNSGELEWSDEVFRIFELNPDEFKPTYDSFLSAIHPDDIEMVKTAYEESIKTKLPYNISHRILMNDGRIKYVHELATFEMDNEEVASSLGTIHDISDLMLTEKALEDKSGELKSALLSIITAMSRSVEARDPYTAGHQKRVSEIATAIAKKMGLSELQVDGIRIGSLIHDIGKLAVPSELLVKPTRLSSIEYALIQEHAKEGATILEGMTFPWPIEEIVSQHHERIDGSGYPNGLKDTEISLEAKVVAVADVFEAMSSHRPYRPSLGADLALGELRKHKGKFYDSEAVDALIDLVTSNEKPSWIKTT